MNNISTSSLRTFLDNGITHVFYERNNVFSTYTYTYKPRHIKIARLIIKKSRFHKYEYYIHNWFFIEIEIPRDQNKLTVFIMCDITQNTKEIKMNIKKIVLRQNYFDHKQILRGQKVKSLETFT